MSDMEERELMASWLICGAFMTVFLSTGLAVVSIANVPFSFQKLRVLPGMLLIRPFVDLNVAAASWVLMGWAMANGGDTDLFIGLNGFATVGKNDYNIWFFGLSLLFVSVSIVSSASLPMMINGHARLAISLFHALAIFPPLFHWVWTSWGWASPYRSTYKRNLLGDCGVIDTAGASVIHMSGGCTGLVMLWLLKYRQKNIYNQNDEMAPMKKIPDSIDKLGSSSSGPPTEPPAVTDFDRRQTFSNIAGPLLLWIGFVGLNVASNLPAYDPTFVAGRRLIMTVLSGGVAFVVGLVIVQLNCYEIGARLTKTKDARARNLMMMKCFVSGLVAISASVSTCEMEGAAAIGIIAAILCVLTTRLQRFIYPSIDAGEMAVSVHLVNGAWGLFAAGLLSSQTGYECTYADAFADSPRYERSLHCRGVFYGGPGHQLGANCVFLLATLAWTVFVMIPFVVFLKIAFPTSFRDGEAESEELPRYVVGDRVRFRQDDELWTEGTVWYNNAKDFTYDIMYTTPDYVSRVQPHVGEKDMRWVKIAPLGKPPPADPQLVVENDKSLEVECFKKKYGYSWDYALVLPLYKDSTLPIDPSIENHLNRPGEGMLETAYSYTSTGKEVVVKLRASVELLRRQAIVEKYRLDLNPETCTAAAARGYPESNIKPFVIADGIPFGATQFEPFESMHVVYVEDALKFKKRDAVKVLREDGFLLEGQIVNRFLRSTSKKDNNKGNKEDYTYTVVCRDRAGGKWKHQVDEGAMRFLFRKGDEVKFKKYLPEGQVRTGSHGEKFDYEWCDGRVLPIKEKEEEEGEEENDEEVEEEGYDVGEIIQPGAVSSTNTAKEEYAWEFEKLQVFNIKPVWKQKDHVKFKISSRTGGPEQWCDGFIVEVGLHEHRNFYDVRHRPIGNEADALFVENWIAEQRESVVTRIGEDYLYQPWEVDKYFGGTLDNVYEQGNEVFVDIIYDEMAFQSEVFPQTKLRAETVEPLPTESSWQEEIRFPQRTIIAHPREISETTAGLIKRRASKKRAGMQTKVASLVRGQRVKVLPTGLDAWLMPPKHRIQDLFAHKVVPEEGDPHPFAAIHRLKLMRGILQGVCGLDLSALVKKGEVLGHFALHSTDDLARLKREWLMPWVLPWDQPIDMVRNYFGEHVAIYFRFSSYYTSCVGLASIVGVGASIHVTVVAVLKNHLFEALQTVLSIPAFCVFITVWSKGLCDQWKRTETEQSVRWGMDQFEDNERNRREFDDHPDTEWKTSFIDGSKVKFYSPTKARRMLIVSVVVTVAMILIAVGAVTIVFSLKFALTRNPETMIPQGEVLANFVNYFQVTILQWAYGRIAKKLNEWENCRTDTIYEDSLIIKLFSFNVVNAYAAVFYIAFIKEVVGDKCVWNSCVGELAQTVLIILGTQALQSPFKEVLLYPFLRALLHLFSLLRKCFRRALLHLFSLLRTCFRYCICCCCGWLAEEVVIDYQRCCCGWLAEEVVIDYQRIRKVEKEFHLEVYDEKDVMEDFSSRAIEFGFLTLFVAAVPIAPLFVFFSSFVEMRVDGYKLLTRFRRPSPTGRQDIGSWYYVFKAISFAGVFTNAGIIFYTGNYFDNLTGVQRLACAAIAVVIIFALQMAYSSLTGGVTPPGVEMQQLRRAYIKKKLFDREPDPPDDPRDPQRQGMSIDVGNMMFPPPTDKDEEREDMNAYEINLRRHLLDKSSANAPENPGSAPASPLRQTLRSRFRT